MGWIGLNRVYPSMITTLPGDVDLPFIEQQWTIDKELAHIPTNEDNAFRERKFKENIHLTEILNVVNALTPQ